MGEMWIEGSRGTLRLDGWARIFHRIMHAADEIEHPYAWSDTGFGGDCVYRLQRHVLAHLVDGSPAMNTGRTYLENPRAVEAVYRSDAEGRRVALTEAADVST